MRKRDNRIAVIKDLKETLRLRKLVQENKITIDEAEERLREIAERLRANGVPIQDNI